MSSSVGGGWLGDRRFASGEVPLRRAGGCSCKQLGTAPLFVPAAAPPKTASPTRNIQHDTLGEADLLRRQFGRIMLEDLPSSQRTNIWHALAEKRPGLCLGVLTRLLTAILHRAIERSRLMLALLSLDVCTRLKRGQACTHAFKTHLYVRNHPAGSKTETQDLLSFTRSTTRAASWSFLLSGRPAPPEVLPGPYIGHQLDRIAHFLSEAARLHP